MRWALAALVLAASTAQAQSPFQAFPPGVFLGHAPFDGTPPPLTPCGAGQLDFTDACGTTQLMLRL